MSVSKIVLIGLVAIATTARADGVASRTVDVDGIKIHYLTAGSGEPLILLHGYAQSSRMWKAAMPRLAKHFTVIAPDLPGFGASAIPPNGLDAKTAATRIHGLAKRLAIPKARVVGHDIGLMVAYAYAAMYPAEVEQLVVMDAFLPGIGDWEATYHDPKLWHFFFHGPTAEALVKGRERIYLDHYWNDFAADPKRSVSDADRQLYTTEYARPHRMRAGWGYFAAFPQTARDFAQLAKTKLAMPILTIAGEKAAGATLGRQLKLVATNVTSVILPATGHWLLDERPEATLDALERFLQPGMAELRLTPSELRGTSNGKTQIGSSGLPGVHTKVIHGDPGKPGLYSILLFVPPHTTIQAHSHRDDRLATVVSGTWRFGYGDRFDASKLEVLPPGSVYSEPGTRAHNHFAQTAAEPVIVHIVGVGPTDTVYVDPAHDPKRSESRGR